MTDECVNMISVIIPVYNTASYLRQCIDSVLGQSYGNIEVILVNDGSTDDSGRICEEYALADSRVRVITQSNRGVSGARNAGLDAAQGDWIAFADADDIYLDGAFGTLASLMSRHGCDMAVGSSIRLEKGQRYVECRFGDALHESPMMALGHYALWGYLFKRTLINQWNLRFREGLKYSEDRVFIFEYALRCHSMASTSRYVYQYRIHPQSACQSGQLRTMAEMQFKAVAEIDGLKRLAADDAECGRLEREEALIVKFTVEKVAINGSGIALLEDLWAMMADMKIGVFPSKKAYYKHCIISRVKGLKRSLLGNKRTMLKE